MALELLAGPFSVRRASGVAVPISHAQLYAYAIYDDTVGIAGTGLGGYCVTQMDGVAYRRADGLFGFGGGSTGVFVLDLRSERDWFVIDPLNMDALYEFDRTTGAVGALAINGGLNALVSITARASDRFLAFFNSYALWRPLDLSAEFAVEFTLVGAGSGNATISRTRKAGVLCLAWGTGQVLFYDHVNKVQVPGSAFVGANTGAWYSPRHDVYVVLTGTTTNQVSVYANSVLAATISTPTASPSLTRGRYSAISVTLAGANGDKPVGELVEWGLVGPGSLLAAQSETDANGVASVGYVAPLTLSTAPTFTATVTR